jgi:hypothetical protein
VTVHHGTGLVTASASGIGKTRLADEFARRIQVRCARGSCPEDGAHRTFWPLREALDEVGLLDENGIAAILGERAEAERTTRIVAGTVGIADPELCGEERPVALAALMDSLAAGWLVLVVDDLQWRAGARPDRRARALRRPGADSASPGSTEKAA